MFIERKETNNTFCEYSDTVHPLRVERRIAGYKPGATYRITLGAYLSTRTTTMHIIMQADTYKLIHHLPASQTTYSQVQSYWKLLIEDFIKLYIFTICYLNFTQNIIFEFWALLLDIWTLLFTVIL